MKALGVKGLTQINGDDPIQELNLKGEMTILEFEKEDLLKVCYPFIETNIVEAIHLPELGLTMWIDEEGKLKNDNLPNLDGTFLYMNQYKVQDVIMGHIVFTSDKTDEDGWALGLEDENIERLKTLILGMQASRPDKAFATDVLKTA
jgi:hypothetical protein